MHHRDLTRRQFLGRSGALLLPALPAAALAQAAAPTRQDWNSFAACEHYASFIGGIARMRAITDSADPRSWRYWSRLYAQQATLGLPYFLAWNRSLLARFERQLQAVAGNPRLTVPYWDCFRDPELPQEFTLPESWNALYAPRAGNNACAALSLAAFAPQVENMQRGLPDAFESIVEGLPHNAVHNLLGNAMAGMQSPEDPIFWLFQANLDRLWTGWMLAAGRNVPAAGGTYWSAAPGDGDAAQAAASTADRRYAETSMPTALSTPATSLSLPGGAPASSFPALAPDDGGLARRTIARLPDSGMRILDAERVALVGARRIVLADDSATVELPLSTPAGALLRELMSPHPANGALGPGVARLLPSAYRSARIVLDDLELTGRGADGGYYYAAYLNLPLAIDAATAQRRHLLGTIGAFEIAAARQRRARGLAATTRVDFAATALLKRLARAPYAGLAVSFCRVNGSGAAPSGGVIAIGELRLELSMGADA